MRSTSVSAAPTRSRDERVIAILRHLLVISVSVILSASVTSPSTASETAAWEALRQGGIALFRHANAPGGGDPSGFRLNDCATQRNLDAVGREQAARIGEAFRVRGVAVGRVLTSQWCRTRETAELAFPGQKLDAPEFNSYFDDRSRGPAQTTKALTVLLGWRGPGALVISTHQVNIEGLTGIAPASGEGIVLRVERNTLITVGRIRP
jgi:phosphohistidine phosphatase SixA